MHDQLLNKLLDYCRSENWKGYDPYDALNSPLCRLMPNSKYLRIAWTQLVKRSPINFRPIAGIKKGENPKGLGLFARALLVAFSKTRDQQCLRDAEGLLERVLKLRSPGYGGRICWGYNFPWQSRAFFVPPATPSIVCTTFIAQAWLDHYELCGDNRSLEVARSACDFLLKDLNRKEDGENFCFSYTPLDRAEVHNANLLGAELLGRVARLSGEKELYQSALRSARFTVAHQSDDGSWPYGTAPFQSWRDSFHTGFNLVSLSSLVKDCNAPEFEASLVRGLQFYNLHFFLADGTPKYYHNRLYPIDIHSAAQAIITFARLKHLCMDATERIERLVAWTVSHMWDERGFFYFQRSRYFANKIPYMRWAQAWMAYALALAVYGE
jgi:hypothetical protein